MTKHLVELMRGSITLSSVRNQGTTVTFAVPAPAVSMQSARTHNGTAGLKPARVKRRTVLLAEDDSDIANLVEAVLSEAGYLVQVVDNGRQVVEAAMRQLPDLVLLDMRMPEMSGFEAVSALRKRQYHGPVIALTASVSEHDRENALRSGCDDFLTKPMDIPTLLSAVDRFL